MTTCTASATSRPLRRRVAAPSPEERLFAATESLRRAAVWHKARWIPDAAAAVDAAVWESIHRGVTDFHALYNVARYAAVAQRRWEMRQRRRPPVGVAESFDPADRAVEVAAAAEAVRHLASTVAAPSADVTEWLDRKTGRSAGAPLPHRVKAAGRRWAARARAALEAVDDVA